MTVSLAEERPKVLSAPSEIAALGTLAAVKSSGERTLPLSRSCGKYVDWYRTS